MKVSVGDVMSWLNEVGRDRTIGDITFEELVELEYLLIEQQEPKKVDVKKVKNGTGKHRAPRKRWTKTEDRDLVFFHDEEKKSFAQIAERLKGRTHASCRIRYNKLKHKERKSSEPETTDTYKL